MKEESINNVTKAVESSTICTSNIDMKSEPIDDVGDVFVPEIGDESDPSNVTCKSDPMAMEVSEDIKLMSCNDCGFKAVENSIFVDHVRTHAKSEQIIPDSLNSSSKQLPDQSQMRLVCGFCNFAGREQSDLIAHMNTHIKNETQNDPVQVHTTSIMAKLALPNEQLQLIEYRINEAFLESSQHGSGTEDVETSLSKDGSDLRLKVSGEYSQVSGPSNSPGPNSGPHKRFSCDVCGYKTNKKVTFEDHLRTHTGEKPFACDLCQYRSSSKHTLGKHKKIHTRPKPFKCDSCEYRGSTRSDLSRHMNTHAKSYALLNGGFVPSDRLQIGAPAILPEPRSEQLTPPQTIFTVLSYDTNLTNVEPIASVVPGSLDEPPAAPELVLLNSAALDGFEENTPRILQPSDDVMLGSRTESSNDPIGNDSIPDGPQHDPLSDEFSQDDTSNSLEPLLTGKPRFTCNFCGYTSSRRQELQVHLRTHTGETPFACDHCDKKYSAKKNLNRHVKSLHGDQQFHCLSCNYNATHKSDMDEHMKIHHNKDGSTREPSNIEFEAQYANDRLSLEQREEQRDSSPSWAYEVTNSGNERFTCEKCGYETHQKVDIESHMMIHTREKFSCELCDMTYTSSRTLNRHVRENHEEKLLDCGVCDYRAHAKSDLTEHMQTHIKGEVENVSSDAKHGFEMELNEASNYSGPSESSQPGNDPSRTEYEMYEPTNDPLQLLSEDHSQDSSLSMHSEAEIGTRNKRFTCDVCGYKTWRKYEFTVHMRTHTGEKPYGCSLCDYRSIKKSYVNKHMKTHLKSANSTGDTVNVVVNTQVEPYGPKLGLTSGLPKLNEASGKGMSESTQTVDEHFTCERCEYKCDDLTAWSQHMFEHTREVFSCDCGFQTKELGQLNVHSKVHTAKVKKVVVTTPVGSTITCEFCDYPFTTKVDMSEHIMSCHPEKCPHACDLCDFKAFSVRSLDLHKGTHSIGIKVEEPRLSHVMSAHAEYVCYSCDYKASSVEAVEQHILTAHNLSAAETTSLSVTTELSLNEIDASESLQPQEYLCYACDYKASEVSQVEEHILRTHTAPNTQEIAVPLATSTSELPGNYLVTSASMGLEEYVCYACDYKACSVALVQQHIQVMHDPSNGPQMDVISDASNSVGPL